MDGEECRSVEDLLCLIPTAPTFGMNARELILQASRRIAAQEKENPAIHSARARSNEDADKQKTLHSFLYKKGPQLLQALPKAERPLVPFKALQRSKVPRITRQAVLDRLVGQHLALALHKAGKTVQGAEIAGLQGQRSEISRAAVEQEERIYQRGKLSKAVYLNYAARTNADSEELKNTVESQYANVETGGDRSLAAEDGGDAAEPCAEADGAQPVFAADSAHESAEGDASAEPADRRSSHHDADLMHSGSRKRQKVEPVGKLIEAEIDWGASSAPRQSMPADPDADAAQSIPQCTEPSLRLHDSQLNCMPQQPDSTVEENGKGIRQACQETSPSDTTVHKQDTFGLVSDKHSPAGRSANEAATPSQACQQHLNGEDQQGWDESRLSAEAYEEYSPSRHGGESPPRVSAEHHCQSTDPSKGDAKLQNRHKEFNSPPGNPKVAAAVAAFLRTHLDPLYQAKVITKEIFKAAMQKTVYKVMQSHFRSPDARFLIKEGGKIQKLLMLHVERLVASQR